MKKEVTQFFKSNPKAKEVHIALGYLCKTKEDAEAILAGVTGHEIQTITKEGHEESQEPSSKSQGENKFLQTFKKLPADKQAKALESQKELVAKKEASLMSEQDQVKAQKALDYHKNLLTEMLAAVTPVPPVTPTPEAPSVEVTGAQGSTESTPAEGTSEESK